MTEWALRVFPNVHDDVFLGLGAIDMRQNAYMRM